MKISQLLIQIIIFTAIPIILGMLLSYIFKRNREEIIKNLKEEHIVIHLPKAYIWVGGIDIAFCFLIVCFPNDTVSTWVMLGFLGFMLLGFIIVVVNLLWKIHIFRSEEYFIYRTAFGRTYKIQYEDCEYYTNGTNILYLKTHKKGFFVDNKASNFEFLLAMLTKHKVKERNEKTKIL